MKKLIGYGYTNSSGVATMTKNASGGNVSGYTGTGAGLMNFRAEMHDDSTVVSQPYPVIDAKFMDYGTDTQYNTNWLNTNSTYLTLQRYTNGTELTNSGSSNYYYFANIPSTGDNEYDWETPFVCEFDIVSFTGNPAIPIYNGTDNALKGFSELSISEGSHVKATANGSTLVYTVDGVDKTPITYSTDAKSRLGFRVSGGGKVKYANFMIY